MMYNSTPVMRNTTQQTLWVERGGKNAVALVGAAMEHVERNSLISVYDFGCSFPIDCIAARKASRKNSSQ